MKLISLIIPTYNEAKNLSPLLEEIWQTIDKSKIDLEFIIVDDNSPDGTGQIAEELSKQYPIKVIHRAGKLGLSSAVIEGFKASKRPYLGVMDADLSHDPVILNKLITSLEEYNIALGSRFEKGSFVEKWPWWRKLISTIGVFLTKKLTGVEDSLSGYFFLRRQVIEDVVLTATGYKILLEILIKGKYKKVKELPFTFRIRRYSTSKLNWQEHWFFAKQLVVYAWYKLFKKFGD